MAEYAFGIDVGGTTIKFGLFQADGSLVEKWEIVTNTDNDGESIIPDIAASLKQKMREHDFCKENIIGAGVGIPGPVMNEREVNMAVNLHWKHKNLADELESLLDGIPVKAGNDANVAALGEMWQGGGKGTKDLIMVTLGTGVGGGIIIDGKIVTGAHGAGGEIGHASLIHEDDTTCNCGNKGCLELAGSATGIVRLAKKELEINGEETVLRGEELSAKLIFDAYKEHDKVAGKIVERFSHYLGNALAVFSCVADPEVIVIGGGVSKAGQILIDGIKKYYKEDAFAACKETPVVLAELGNDAGIYGAAKLAVGQ